MHFLAISFASASELFARAAKEFILADVACNLSNGQLAKETPRSGQRCG
jgi:hypothetical protein